MEYGAKTQYAKAPDTSEALNVKDIKQVQEVLGTLLYYARAVDSIIRSLERKPSIISMAILAAMYSEPNVDVSTVFCCLEYHKIGAQFTKMSIPDCYRRVV
jgi:hypothetical protein